ncbi:MULTISPECIES: phasin family protein [unclassified Rhizobium]|uniref:phasin family protein n=1 Tax=unclassified Rhizobium TaxID=2613769 RepID=UPI0016033BC8|nr:MULTISPECIES: TIGR01841 family phasin [unclassified Rhizobium]MBB1249899.1 TIGR01841 family phasin [Rhizobium sp. G21]MCV3765834.1 TIGR01841 family phasin [Rhizobium sp. TRM95796]
MPAKKTDDVFAMNAFDPSKFTDNFRDFAEKSSVKTKEALAKMKEATEEAGKTVEATMHSAQTGAVEFGMKAIEILRANTESSYAHMESLLGVKSVAELFELQTAFVRKQAETAVAQAKSLQETSKKVADEVTKPGKAAAEKAMSGFKLSA